MILVPYRRPQPSGLPPVDSLADGEDDPVLGRWLGRLRRHHKPGLAHALRLEFLDHRPVEARSEGAARDGGTSCAPSEPDGLPAQSSVSWV